MPTVIVSGPPEPPALIETATSAAPTAAPLKRPGAIAWEASEVTARERSRARKAPLLVFLCAAWATASVQMDRTTWSDARVVERARAFVALRLDATDTDASAQAAADRFDLKTLPSTVILDENGREIARLEGFTRPEEMLAALERAAHGD